jgi:phosphate transport system permease protein
MTTLTELFTEPPPGDEDQPRSIDSGIGGSDRVFQISATGIGAVVLILTGAIGLFLGYQLLPTLRDYGLHFFTAQQWSPDTNQLGIAGVLVGTVEVALIALAISFPLSLATALFISEYAPESIKGTLVALIDLMAAVPSIVYGLWGVFLIEPHALYVARWINAYFGWFPLFHVNADPRAANFSAHLYEQSAFIAGLIVSMMVVPLGCAVMRGVFAQAPIGEREAAYALGATKWGMIRSVVIPFGRGGIIGGTMLSLGRALGETVAVLLIISPEYDVKLRPLESGTITVASLIANQFNDASSSQLSALLAAGFVLFVMTIAVNTVAAIIVNRGRSGAQTDA